jgi:hypothetical protein
MKHIDTTATAIRKIKSEAKKLKVEQSITLSQALELAAKKAGYDNLHHATCCAANSKKITKFNGLGNLKLRFFEYEGTVRFELDDDDLLDEVTEELDDVVDEAGGGYGDMSEIPTTGLKRIIAACEMLTKREPAFLDGYAHWVGAFVAIKKNKEAVDIGLPVLDAAFKLADTSPKKYKFSYYELPNRPFFRLAHNLVLAYYGNGQNVEAKSLAEKMYKLWPNDNMGFRFLLEPLDKE